MASADTLNTARMWPGSRDSPLSYGPTCTVGRTKRLAVDGGTSRHSSRAPGTTSSRPPRLRVGRLRLGRVGRDLRHHQRGKTPTKKAGERRPRGLPSI